MCHCIKINHNHHLLYTALFTTPIHPITFYIHSNLVIHSIHNANLIYFSILCEISGFPLEAPVNNLQYYIAKSKLLVKLYNFNKSFSPFPIKQESSPNLHQKNKDNKPKRRYI
ncbi:unnamed protein product [Orchesella dallaii]|uniref:Uncharacterized protein n=1 Tax=Orchesella dallaii TaxID=48710 RepID=A0ABP1S461_9HEXA